MTTLVQTQTLIIAPRTVTARCSGATRTVTVYPQTPTVVVTSTAVRTATDGQVTRYWTTTATATASCHYPSSWSSPANRTPAPTASWCVGRDDCEPFWRTGGGGGGGGWWWRTRWTPDADPTVPLEKRDVATTAAAAAVAAVTSTYTQTTYTVTSTLVTTAPGRTTTELGKASFLPFIGYSCPPADRGHSPENDHCHSVSHQENTNP